MKKDYPKKIALIGYMGAGKTHLGRELAAKLKLPFFDLDGVIGQMCGCNQSDIIRRKGEIAFREAENKALNMVLGKDKFVLACGGGTPAYFDNMDQLTKNAHVVYLDCSIPTLVNRLLPEKCMRPLIEKVADEELEEFIAKHLFERRPYYEKAHVKIEANDISVDHLLPQLS